MLFQKILSISRNDLYRALHFTLTNIDNKNIYIVNIFNIIDNNNLIIDNILFFSFEN